MLALVSKSKNQPSLKILHFIVKSQWRSQCYWHPRRSVFFFFLPKISKMVDPKQISVIFKSEIEKKRTFEHFYTFFAFFSFFLCQPSFQALQCTTTLLHTLFSHILLLYTFLIKSELLSYQDVPKGWSIFCIRSISAHQHLPTPTPCGAQGTYVHYPQIRHCITQ